MPVDFADTTRTNSMNQPGRSQDVIYYDAVVKRTRKNKSKTLDSLA